MGDPSAALDLIREEGWLGIAVAFLVYGGGAFLLGVVKDLRKRRLERPTPQDVHLREVDQSMLTVAKARDELAEDNALLRAENARLRAARVADEDRLIAAHAVERQEWSAERTELRDEIERLEARLQAEAERHAQAYATLLSELSALKNRATNGHGEH